MPLGMTLGAWLAESTAASNVPLKVTDAAVLLDLAALVARGEF